jgi:hypothetical protein
MSLFAAGQILAADTLNQKTVFIGTSAPASPTDAQVWIDTSKTPPQLKVYDNDGAKWVPVWPDIKYKSADETVTNSTTYQDDDHITGWDIVANGKYLLEGELIVNIAAGGTDVKVQISTSQTISTRSKVIHEKDGQTATDIILSAESSAVTSHELGTLSGGNDTWIYRFWATIVVGATSGTLKLQWAQATANAVGTTLKKYSWVKLTPIP